MAFPYQCRKNRGNYSKNYVKMRKEYIEGDMEDQDVYIAIGQILPWGMYGRWKLEDEDREPQRCGYWGMWIFEVRCVFHC